MNTMYGKYLFRNGEEARIVYHLNQGFCEIIGVNGARQGEIDINKPGGLINLLKGVQLFADSSKIAVASEELNELELSDAGFDSLFKTPTGYDLPLIMKEIKNMKQKGEKPKLPLTDVPVHIPIDETLVEKIGSARAGEYYSHAESL